MSSTPADTHPITDRNGRRGRTLVRMVALTAIVLAVAAAAQRPAAAQEMFVDPVVSATPTSESTIEPIEVPSVGEKTGPDVSVSVVEDESGRLSTTVTILLLLTVLSAAPGLLLLTTSFTRFVIVLGLTRNAVGSQNVPPNQVLVGLALFLTLFVMGPIFSKMNDEAIQPLLAGDITQDEAFDAGFEPLRSFMMSQTRDEDLALFMGISGADRPESVEEISAGTLIPAFVISELRTAFIIGFLIFIPFLVIDLIVAAVLMSMGMVMLPPVFISLPLKILLFVLVDGWALIVGSIVSSVGSVS